MTRERQLLVIAIGTLCIGVLVYVFDRTAQSIYFLPEALSLNQQTGRVFGGIGDSLPTFVHVYAFILLTVVVDIPAGIKLMPVCLGWFTLESLFEDAQFNPIAHWLASHTPNWFSGIPVLENTADYFLLGTFDVFDLLSIAAGTLAAYLTLYFSLGESENVTAAQ